MNQAHLSKNLLKQQYKQLQSQILKEIASMSHIVASANLKHNQAC